MNLNDLALSIVKANKAKGFHDKPQEVGTYLMLMVSELSEALEADRKGKYANIIGLESDMKFMSPEDYGGYPREYSIAFENTVKDSFEDELADALIRILDLAGYMNIDIQKHVDYKLKYNSYRPKKHGKAY